MNQNRIQMLLILILLTLGSVIACGDGSLLRPEREGNQLAQRDGELDSNSTLGLRCRTAGDCGQEEECFSEFILERLVCTQSCNELSPCPQGTQCVGDVSHYNNGTVGPYCLKSCQNNQDCEALGSECDTAGSQEVRYCL